MIDFQNLRHRKKSFWSKIKGAYIKKYNVKKFWKKIKINKIDDDLKKLVDYYIFSESFKFSSNYWNKLNVQHLNLINEYGIEKFHLKISHHYFTWFDFNDKLIKGLLEFFEDNHLTDIPSKLLLTKNTGLTISQSMNYNLILILLYKYLLKKDQFDNLKSLEKNDFFINNCPNLKIDNLTITQDKLNSLMEFIQIKKLIIEENIKLNILEIGAGSGRTTETIIRLDKRINKYVIADFPPALYINFLRIKHTFKDLKMKLCINVESKNDFKNLIDENDVLFILPHQINYFEDKFFDISLAIDCLHEMDKKIIKKYMEIFNVKSNYLYFKVWEETYVPHDFNNYLNSNSKEDYFINPNWKQILKNKCIFPSNFQENIYKIS